MIRRRKGAFALVSVLLGLRLRWPRRVWRNGVVLPVPAVAF